MRRRGRMINLHCALSILIALMFLSGVFMPCINVEASIWTSSDALGTTDVQDNDGVIDTAGNSDGLDLDDDFDDLNDIVEENWGSNKFIPNTWEAFDNTFTQFDTMAPTGTITSDEYQNWIAAGRPGLMREVSPIGENIGIINPFPNDPAYSNMPTDDASCDEGWVLVYHNYKDQVDEQNIYLEAYYNVFEGIVRIYFYTYDIGGTGPYACEIVVSAKNAYTDDYSTNRFLPPISYLPEWSGKRFYVWYVGEGGDGIIFEEQKWYNFQFPIQYKWDDMDYLHIDIRAVERFTFEAGYSGGGAISGRSYGTEVTHQEGWKVGVKAKLVPYSLKGPSVTVTPSWEYSVVDTTTSVEHHYELEMIEEGTIQGEGEFSGTIKSFKLLGGNINPTLKYGYNRRLGFIYMEPGYGRYDYYTPPTYNFKDRSPLDLERGFVTVHERSDGGGDPYVGPLSDPKKNYGIIHVNARVDANENLYSNAECEPGMFTIENPDWTFTSDITDKEAKMYERNVKEGTGYVDDPDLPYLPWDVIETSTATNPGINLYYTENIPSIGIIKYYDIQLHDIMRTSDIDFPDDNADPPSDEPPYDLGDAAIIFNVFGKINVQIMDASEVNRVFTVGMNLPYVRSVLREISNIFNQGEWYGGDLPSQYLDHEYRYTWSIDKVWDDITNNDVGAGDHQIYLEVYDTHFGRCGWGAGGPIRLPEDYYQSNDFWFVRRNSFNWHNLDPDSVLYDPTDDPRNEPLDDYGYSRQDDLMIGKIEVWDWDKGPDNDDLFGTVEDWYEGSVRTDTSYILEFPTYNNNERIKLDMDFYVESRDVRESNVFPYHMFVDDDIVKETTGGTSVDFHFFADNEADEETMVELFLMEEEIYDGWDAHFFDKDGNPTHYKWFNLAQYDVSWFDLEIIPPDNPKAGFYEFKVRVSGVGIISVYVYITPNHGCSIDSPGLIEVEEDSTNEYKCELKSTSNGCDVFDLKVDFNPDNNPDTSVDYSLIKIELNPDPVFTRPFHGHNDESANQRAYFSLKVTVDDETPQGDYFIDISAESMLSSGYIDPATIIIRVTPKYGVDLIYDGSTPHVDPEETAIYQIIIKNTGRLDDIYSISLTPTPETATWTFNYPTSTPVMVSEEELLFNVEATPPALTPPTTDVLRYLFDLTATSQTETDVSETLTLETVVNEVTGISMECNVNSKHAYPGDSIVYTITIKNKDNTPGNDYDVNLFIIGTPAGWNSYLSTSSVFVPYGGSAQVDLTVDVSSNNWEAFASPPPYEIKVRGVATLHNPPYTPMGEDTVTTYAHIYQLGGVDVIEQSTLNIVSPGYAGYPGTLLNYKYTVQNMGNGEDSFLLRARSTMDWQHITISVNGIIIGGSTGLIGPLPPYLGPTNEPDPLLAASARIVVVSVLIPEDAKAYNDYGTQNELILYATSIFDEEHHLAQLQTTVNTHDNPGSTWIGSEFIASDDYDLSKVEFHLSIIGPWTTEIRVYNSAKNTILADGVLSETNVVGYYGAELNQVIRVSAGTEYFIAIRIEDKDIDRFCGGDADGNPDTTIHYSDDPSSGWIDEGSGDLAYKLYYFKLTDDDSAITTVLQEYSVAAWVSIGEKQKYTDPNVPVDYTIKITNYGNGKDTVNINKIIEIPGELGSEGYWTTAIVPNTFEMEAFSSTYVTLTVTPWLYASGGVTGIVTVIVNSENPLEIGTTSVLTTVNRFYGLDILLPLFPGEYIREVDLSETVAYEYSIVNIGSTAEFINFRINGLQDDWEAWVDVPFAILPREKPSLTTHVTDVTLYVEAPEYAHSFDEVEIELIAYVDDDDGFDPPAYPSQTVTGWSKTSISNDKENSWEMFHNNERNTGYTLSSGPTDDHIRWQFLTGGHIKSSPSISNGIVFVSSVDGKLYAINEEDGSPYWPLPYSTGGAITSSPAVDPNFGTNGLVFVGSDDCNLYAVDMQTGHYMWHATTGGRIISSPVVDPAAGINGLVIVGSEDGYVYAFDELDGHRVWISDSLIDVIHLPVDEFVISTPAIADGMVFIGDGYRSLIDMNYHGYVRAIDENTGLTIWTTLPSQIMGRVISSPTVTNNMVFVGVEDIDGDIGTPQGGVIALTKYGTLPNILTPDLIWSYETPDAVVSSPAVATHKVFVGCDDGYVYALEMYDHDYDGTAELYWSHLIGSPVKSSPTISENGVVFIGATDGCVYALDMEGNYDLTTKEIWSFSTEGSIVSSPSISDDIMFIGSDDGNLYAFDGHAIGIIWWPDPYIDDNAYDSLTLEYPQAGLSHIAYIKVPKTAEIISASLDLTGEMRIDDFPTDVYVNIGDDATIEWSQFGPLVGSVVIDDSVTIPPLSSSVQNYVHVNNPSDSKGFVYLPISFGSSTDGLLTISNIKIIFAYQWTDATYVGTPIIDPLPPICKKVTVDIRYIGRGGLDIQIFHEDNFIITSTISNENWDTPASVKSFYDDLDQDGIIDGTSYAEATLVMFWWNDELQAWIPASEEFGEENTGVDATNNNIWVNADHFSDFKVKGSYVPIAETEGIINALDIMNIEDGVKNSLKVKLEASLAYLDMVQYNFVNGNLEEGNENLTLAQIKLNDFINEVNAQGGKKISEQLANILMTNAQQITIMINDAYIHK